MARVAWVESPLQLLNAVEYAQASGERLHICLRDGVAQLGTTGRLIAPSLPRGVTMSGGWSSAAASPFLTAHERLVGDINSGQVHAVIALTGVRDMVIVDDGAGMLTVARSLGDEGTLERHGRHSHVMRRSLGVVVAGKVLDAARRGRVALFTAYDGAEPVQRLATIGFTLSHNAYTWIARWRPPAGRVLGEHIVVGSALVEDGFVSADAYEGWLRSLARAGDVSYLPHRRESSRTLSRWAHISGVTIAHTRMPIELVLGASSTVRTVVTLPSSVVATLSGILDGRVDMRVEPVPQEWLTSAADARLRALLHDVTAGEAIRAAA